MKQGYRMDADFLSSPEGGALMAEYGFEGLGMFTALCAQLWKAENATLRHDQSKAIAYLLRIDSERFCDFVDWLEVAGVLITDGQSYWVPFIRDDKEKLLAKQNTLRANAMRSHSKSSPISTPTPAPICSANREANQTAKAERITVYVSDPVTDLDDLTKETAVAKLRSNGLTADDLPRALEIVGRHYHQNPHKKRPGGLVFDVAAPWVVKLICDEKTAQTRLKRALEPPPKSQSSAEIADGWITESRNKTKKNQQATS